MGDIYFVTGVDTGVGKTVVSCALVAALLSEGVSTTGLKPIESGCQLTPDGLKGEDIARLAKISRVTPEACGLIRLELPLAPSTAARLAGHPPIDLDRIVEWVALQAERHQCVVVEGVGGVMVPLNQSETVLDLIVRLQPSGVFLVAGNRLGVLSQTLSATYLLKERGLPLGSTVLNQAGAASGLAEETNLDELARWVSPVVSFPTVDVEDEAALVTEGRRLLQSSWLPALARGERSPD